MAGVELGQHLVPGAPPSVYYVPDFITQAEEEGLLRQVEASPAPRWPRTHTTPQSNTPTHPDLHPPQVDTAEQPAATELGRGAAPQGDVGGAAAWLAGAPGGQGHRRRHPPGQVGQPRPRQRVQVPPDNGRNIFGALLLCVYSNPRHARAGQGILPHTDGPLFHPSVATVSLGSHTVLRLYSPLEGEGAAQPWEEREVGALLLRPRSLLVLRGEAYSSLLHGIQEVEEDTLGPGILNLGEEEEEEGATTLARSTRVSLTIRHVPNTTRCKIRIGR